MKAIQQLKEIRRLVILGAARLSDDQLQIVPPGHKNNILWNLGHLVVTQQLLHYKLSGLPLYIPDALCDAYMKGTSPANIPASPNIAELRDYLVSLPEKLESDWSAGKFREFSEYATSAGITLTDIEDAILFNNFHEGIHLGVILSLRKQVA